MSRGRTANGNPECKVLFTTQNIGKMDNSKLLTQIEAEETKKPRVVILRGPSGNYTTYDELISSTKLNPADQSDDVLDAATRRVLPHQVCNLQFTSGTTGNPKAAMLTHQYVASPIRAFPHLPTATTNKTAATSSTMRAS